MSLPKFNPQDPNVNLLQTTWKQQLDPVLAQPIISSTIIKSVALTTGKNTVNHMLGTTLQGWMVIRQRGTAAIYDIQDTNPIPNKTLLLMSSSGVSVDLMVF